MQSHQGLLRMSHRLFHRSRFLARFLARFLVGWLAAICALSWLVGQAANSAADIPGLIWDKPQTITRKPPRRVTNRPRPPKVLAPLLTMRWQVQTLPRNSQGCAALPVNTTGHTFQDKDEVRLAVQVNQKGYMYIINHTESPDGRIIEGPKLISLGQYEAEKNMKQLLPPACPPQGQRCGECWWGMYSPAGREVITVVFSRDEIDELFNRENQDKMVSASFITELQRLSPAPRHRPWPVESQRRARLSGVIGEHVTMVWNPNAQDNEVLVERIVLDHQ